MGVDTFGDGLIWGGLSLLLVVAILWVILTPDRIDDVGLDSTDRASSARSSDTS